MPSPTFVATFVDGTVIRMSTYCADGNLDLGRGVRLSQAAYESRRKQQPPAMAAGHFETPPNGGGCAAVVLRTYTSDELAVVTGVDAPGSITPPAQTIQNQRRDQYA